MLEVSNTHWHTMACLEEDHGVLKDIVHVFMTLELPNMFSSPVVLWAHTHCHVLALSGVFKSHLFIVAVLFTGCCYYVPFTDEETEAQRGEVS